MAAHKKIQKKKVQKPKIGVDSSKDQKLINKLVITTKKASKKAEKLCSQLRKVFYPNCLAKLKDLSPKFQDCVEVSDACLVSHIIVVSDSEIQIGIRPKGPTYVFKILEYDDRFKNFHFDIYKDLPYITYDGKSALKQVFDKFGKNESNFKRSLHFKFDGNKIYLRHYCTSTEDMEDNYKVGLREIGPRLTLEYKDEIKEFFPQYKVHKRRFQKNMVPQINNLN